MNNYQETFETWNKVALLYQDKFMVLDLYNETYDYFCNAVEKKNAKILDIGCGPGNITKYLLTKRPDFQIEGIDIAPNMIELAKNNNPTANFQLMDSRQIHQLNSKFDGIICGFCLPYLSETDSLNLISDTFNLLNDEGLFYLSFVEGDPNDSGFQVASSGDRTYFYYFNLDNLMNQLINIGFEKPTIFKVNYKNNNGNPDVHTILITKKNS